MRKLFIAGLALGAACLVLPTAASAAVFSLAPAVQAAGDHSIQQATPIDEVRSTRRRRSSSSRTRSATR